MNTRKAEIEDIKNLIKLVVFLLLIGI